MLFLAEKKKTQNWFQRQFTGKMSEDYDSIVEIEHATAVAAAAFAVKSVEEAAISDKKRAGNETGDSLVKIKSKKEETTLSKPEAGRLSKLFSGNIWYMHNILLQQRVCLLLFSN